MMGGLQYPERKPVSIFPPGNENTLYFIMRGQVLGCQ